MRGSVELDINGFHGNYARLNARKIMEDVSLFDLTRAVITLNHPNLNSPIQQFGIERWDSIYSDLKSKLTVKEGYWVYKDNFWGLGDECRTTSERYGEAFTKLFAERYLDCKQVDRFKSAPYDVKITDTSKGFKSKVVKYHCTKRPASPDFIAFGASSFHAVEAKGFASGFSGREFQHAINQVSIINNVNGVEPLTKTACFFDLSRKLDRFKGYIQDPISGNFKIDLTFDPNKFLNSYYARFNQNPHAYTIKLGRHSFKGYILDKEERIFFGADEDVLNRVNANSEFQAKPKQYDFSRYNFKYSAGPDGIIFIEGMDIKDLMSGSLFL